MAGHASVALENARLYESQRREAESAKALLEFSRDLAEAASIVDVAERATDGHGAHPREPERVGLAPERDATDRWSGSRASRSLRPTAGSRRESRVEHLEPWLGRREPYTVDPEDYAAISSAPEGTEGRFAIAPFVVEGRWGVVAAAIALRSSDRGSRPRAPRQHRAPDASRAADGRELREPRAHLPLDRGGARERSRGEGRVHVEPRALDHGPRAPGRRRARARAAGAQAPRARRPLPRHRQDRHPVGDPGEGRPAHRGGARDRGDPPGARRAHPRAHRAARRGAAHRALRPRALRRHRVSRPPHRASRSRSSRASSSPATPSTR